MQLKLTRSQKTGALTGAVIFCIYARVEFTEAESQSLSRYKLRNLVIYNSEASKRHLDHADALRGNSVRGNVKALGLLALAAMKLNIRISGLERGQYVECKSMEELLGAEDAIMEACKTLKGYLGTAATFDGREVLISFEGDEPTVVAVTTTPSPQLISPNPALPQLEYDNRVDEWSEADHSHDADDVATYQGAQGPIDWSDFNTRLTIFLIGGFIVLAILLKLTGSI